MNQEYLDDIKDIKVMMEERARFLSLSGLSGILAGIYALAGAYIAYYMARTAPTIAYKDLQNGWLSPTVIKLLGVAAVVLILSLITAYYFTSRKAKRRNEAMWSSASHKAAKSFLIPLITGGLFGLLLIKRTFFSLIAPTTLIFYGLALYSASRYTYRDVGFLGLLEVATGLVAMLFPSKGLYFWAFGFGVLHIVYGIIMYYKYDKEDKKV